MKWAVYNLLFLLVYPFLLPGFLARMFRRGGYAARMGDRFALYPQAVRRTLLGGRGRWVWIHAVSVGEVQVAGQLMRAWRQVEPSVAFCFSTTSSTGWKMAEREVREGDVLIYNPLDFPTFVRAALETVRPRAVILTESELWPNFIRKAKAFGVPLYLVNARVSDRSAPRYRSARFFFGDVLRSFRRIFAQSELDKARLVAAGARAEDVAVTGSFKFDVAHRNEAKERELRDWLGACPGGLLLGGSTWPGEDALLLRAYRRILSAGRSPEPVLVIAPRHFEKADEIEANIKAAGFACVRRSRGDGPPPSALRTVYLADTTGELMGLYGLADVVFVGKSVCAHGSQNMIEPCLCGKPTFVGPFTENFRPVMSDLLAADAIVQAADAQAVEDGLVAAFSERTAAGFAPESRWARLEVAAQAAVARRCGVVARCVDEIRRALAVLVVLLSFAGCSREEKPAVRETCAAVKAAVRGIYRLENAVADPARRPVFVSLDVADLTANDLLARLGPYTNRAEDVHLWMPGEQSWILTVHAPSNRVSLSAAMEALAGDPSCTVSLPEVFASYAGTLSDVLPAFAGAGEAPVVPETFVMREIPALAWLDTADVDDDILSPTCAQIRSMQVVRRLVLEGNMAARKVRETKDEAEVKEMWARAYLRNPHDPLLLERLDRLNRNARGFLSVNKPLQAMKCYETIILVTPDDAVAVRNFGKCLERIGRLDMARQVMKRADELDAARE